MHTRPFIFLLMAFSLAAAERPKLAQTRALRVEAPVASYAVFGTGIRALVGLPGLLDWSEPLALPASYERLAVAPGERYAMGASGARVALLGFDGLAVAETGHFDAGASIERIVFSPLGHAAALETAGGYRVVTGLPGAPALGEARSGSVVALSDDGSAAVVREGNTVALRDMRLDGFEAAAFVPGSSRLIAVLGGKLALLENGALRTIAEPAGSVRDLVVSASGRTAYLAISDRLWTVELDRAEMRPELVEAGSGRLHRTRVNDRILLMDEASGGAQIVWLGAEGLQASSLRLPAVQGN